jgi:mRNA interferase HigB
VNVISKRVLFEKVQEHPDARAAIQTWWDAAVEAQWRSLEDVRHIFPRADMVGPLVIFNIHGNRYRLIVRMEFRYQRIYIKEFLTHAEYSKEGWKKWL